MWCCPPTATQPAPTPHLPPRAETGARPQSRPPSWPPTATHSAPAKSKGTGRHCSEVGAEHAPVTVPFSWTPFPFPVSPGTSVYLPKPRPQARPTYGSPSAPPPASFQLLWGGGPRSAAWGAVWQAQWEAGPPGPRPSPALLLGPRTPASSPGPCAHTWHQGASRERGQSLRARATGQLSLPRALHTGRWLESRLGARHLRR